MSERTGTPNPELWMDEPDEILTAGQVSGYETLRRDLLKSFNFLETRLPGQRKAEGWQELPRQHAGVTFHCWSRIFEQGGNLSRVGSATFRSPTKLLLFGVHTSAQDKTKRIWVSDILWENPASKYQPPTIFSRDFDITLHDDTAITDLKFSTNIEVTDPSSVITDQITLSTDEITAALTMDIYFEDFTSYRMTELIGILDDMTDAVIDN